MTTRGAAQARHLLHSPLTASDVPHPDEAAVVRREREAQ